MKGIHVHEIVVEMKIEDKSIETKNDLFYGLGPSNLKKKIESEWIRCGLYDQK